MRKLLLVLDCLLFVFLVIGLIVSIIKKDVNDICISITALMLVIRVIKLEEYY